MDTLESQNEQVGSTDTQSSPETITAKDVFNTDWTKNLNQEPTSKEEAATIYELEKLSKFKYQGQELTPKDLEAMILRQKDYTQKTQALSKERESLQSEQKFYENLYHDLNNVKNNPELANEFIKVYPEKFHTYLKQVLGQSEQTQNAQNQKPQFDVDTAARLQKLEAFYYEQEVAKNTQQMDAIIDKLSPKYSDAIPELVISRIWEAYNRGEKITPEVWENTFKTADAEMKERIKAKYGDLVKKQTEANNKSRDVDSGGGTVGRAPQKFKSLSDVTKYAVKDLTNRE